MASEQIGPRITGMQHDVEEIKRHMEHIANQRDGNQNVTKIVFEGGKSAVVSLLVGLVGGVCIGGSVFAVGWIASALEDVRETQRDQQAFIQVTYQQLPMLRAEYDRIRTEQAQKGQKTE
jgi:uncharacterized membrane protein YjjP (DUF1212 family)